MAHCRLYQESDRHCLNIQYRCPLFLQVHSRNTARVHPFRPYPLPHRWNRSPEVSQAPAYSAFLYNQEYLKNTRHPDKHGALTAPPRRQAADPDSQESPTEALVKYPSRSSWTCTLHKLSDA